MPRLIRRKPLLERITSMLNPMDFLLWLSEEIETREWDSALVGTQLGIAANFVFLLARANSSVSEASNEDIFGEDTTSSWLSWFVSPIVWALVALSCTNAIYALSRTRKYRLFQSDIDQPLATSSARRVKVNSVSNASSPLRYLVDMITSDSAESRAHPNKSLDVWELSVWDPVPMTLRLFCLFSPGHVLVYLLFLPLAPLDPQPSVTVFNTIIMQILLSGQMLLLSSRFAQQAKDNNILQKEVMNEYETKFVRPRLQPMVRDVGIQHSYDQSTRVRNFVQVGTPTTSVRHAYLSRPKATTPTLEGTPSVSDPAGSRMSSPSIPRRVETMAPSTDPRASIVTPASSFDNTPTPIPNKGVSVSTSTTDTTYGGHMGIYNHANSPLKKASRLHEMNDHNSFSPRNSREMAAFEQRSILRPSSPTKQAELRRMSALTAGNANAASPFVRGGTRERPLPRW